MTRTRVGIGMVAMAVAACGGGDGAPVVRGDFAPGWDPAPDGVRAVWDGREVPVRDGEFVLEGLSAGPMRLRILADGDTVGRLDVRHLPAGTELTLHGLRVDEESGYAFPREIELRGEDLVRVNGLRMAPRSRLRGDVDAAGTVLAVSGDGAVVLLRPDDEEMPDLRVFAGKAAEVVTADGDPVEADALERGDSVRVVGRMTDGYVLVTRLVVPRRLATRAESEPPQARRASAESSPTRAVPAARERGRSARGERPGRGKGRDRERGRKGDG